MVMFLPSSRLLRRHAVRARIYEIQRDDELIKRDGLDALDSEELHDACRVRGMHVHDVPEAVLCAKLAAWVELSTTVRFFFARPVHR